MRPSLVDARPEQHAEAGAGAEVDVDLDHEVGGGGDVGERPTLVGAAHHQRALALHLDQRQRVAELPVGAGGRRSRPGTGIGAISGPGSSAVSSSAARSRDGLEDRFVDGLEPERRRFVEIDRLRRGERGGDRRRAS